MVNIVIILVMVIARWGEKCQEDGIGRVFSSESFNYRFPLLKFAQ
jgi:hypothetical protein